MREASVVIECFKHAKLCALTNRTAIYAGIFQALVNSCTGLIALWAILEIKGGVGGWNKIEVVAVYGLFLAMDGVVGVLFIPSLQKLPEQIRNGWLECVMLRPSGIRKMIIFGQMNFWRIPEILVGFGIFFYAVFELSGTSMLGGLLGLSAGIIILYSMWQFCFAFSLRYVRLNNASQLLVIPLSIARFPTDSYPKWLGLTLNSFLPVALVTNVPVALYTGRLNNTSIAFYIAIVVVFFSLSTLAFRSAINQFEGS